VREGGAVTVDELMGRMDLLRQVDYMAELCWKYPGAANALAPFVNVGWDWEPGTDTHAHRPPDEPAKTSPETGNR